MELLNPPVRSLPLSSSHVSLFTPKSFIKTCNTKTTPYRFHIPTSKFLKSPSTPFHLPFSTTRKVHVSAHFSRAARRSNSLRKKLFEHQQVRQKNPISQDPNLNFDNLNHFQENLDYDSVKESDSSYGFSLDNDLVELDGVKGWKPKSKKLGESVLSTRLENWVDQYNKDTAYWGIGSSPIFTVFHDLQGNVKSVLVDEDEILKRIQVEKRQSEDLKELESKILYAKSLARDMERGGTVIPRNSSIAKFVVSGEESGFLSAIQGVALLPEVIPVLSRVGGMVFFSFVAIWAAKKLFTFGNKDERYTVLEKEMMRRKIKSRKEKELLEKGRVEVVQETLEPQMVSTERPKLDKQELIKSIFEAKASKDKLLLAGSFSSQTTNATDFDNEIQTIRTMARKAREIERRELYMFNKDEEEKQPVNKELSSEMQVAEKHIGEVVNFPTNIENEDSRQKGDTDETRVRQTLNEPMSDDTGCHPKVSSEENRIMQASSTSKVEVSEERQTMVTGKVIHSSDTSVGKLHASKNRSIRMKPKVIRSVKEAREFLANKGDNHIQEPQFNAVQESTTGLSMPGNKTSSGKTSQRGDMDVKDFEPSMFARTSDSLPAANACKDFSSKEEEFIPTKNDASRDSVEGSGMCDLQKPQTFLNVDINGRTVERRQSVKMENWLEQNFHEVEPIVRKIGDGFMDNYEVAREKVNQHTNASADITQLDYNEVDSELEWMKDDGLRDIVFQVQENELAGRDPFYQMDAEDKLKFFKGLEKKVEKENQKLFHVHEYLHSNIENLDYGADGISLYDPPEKFIPRWKGPPLEKNPEFLNNFLEQRNAIFAGNVGTSYPMKKDEQTLLQKSSESPINENLITSSADYALKKNLNDKDKKNCKTVIEGSDGSVRAGKKSGKEYWQHTKKWSQGFLESYNAETDPEVKSVMKDIGKDLDRWITEEEIQVAASLMTKAPERNKKFMEKKIKKLKKEMELFGPQAVVSKYREYADDKEEDYLWWLDLPHVLCIELYTTENGEHKVGFYSLEMAEELELEPKPCHVIAFEDAGECKNLCYIIQAHMDVLGNGHAFVVPRPPKDAFREAKANGFSVTVIRKGELQLNVDQTLEEVEEQITEIGSKIYHDKLTKECSVDINSLMKGIFGANGQTTPTKRKRAKRRLKKPTKK